MELIDRYLQAIKTFLPGKEKDDVLQELRESLLSQMDEKEQSLGRPLNPDEAEAIICENGPPFMVAARFGPHRSLIGPALFPFYWLALKLLLLIALVIQLIESSIRVIVKSDPSTLFAIPGNLFFEAVWITALFAVVEYAVSFAEVKVKPFRWNPKSLPKLRGEVKVVRRSESIAAIVFGIAGLIWLRSLPNGIFLGGRPDLQFAPIWSTLYWLFIGLAAAGIARSVALLINPYWVGFNRVSGMLMNVATLVAFVLVFRGGPWVSVLSTSANRSHWESVALLLNQVFYYSLLCGVILIAIRLAWDIYRLIRQASLRKTHGLSVAFL